MGALILLSLLAAASVVASDLPRTLAWPLAVAVFAYGGWLARHESRRPVQRLAWPGNGAAATVDDGPVRGMVVHWRGPLASASWLDADGRRQRLHWWPDTLPAVRRRELRLAASPAAAVPAPPSMAP